MSGDADRHADADLHAKDTRGGEALTSTDLVLEHGFTDAVGAFVVAERDSSGRSRA